MADTPARKPATGVVQLAEDDEPWIRGFRCAQCGAVVGDATPCCRACANRAPPSAFRVGAHGKLYSWSIVHRSFPGVAVPFVSAIVDLDDGLTLKGTLRAVAPEALRGGLPVTLVFDDAGGAHDTDGAAYVGFHFVEAPGGEP